MVQRKILLPSIYEKMHMQISLWIYIICVNANGCPKKTMLLFSISVDVFFISFQIPVQFQFITMTHNLTMVMAMHYLIIYKKLTFHFVEIQLKTRTKLANKDMLKSIM